MDVYQEEVDKITERKICWNEEISFPFNGKLNYLE